MDLSEIKAALTSPLELIITPHGSSSPTHVTAVLLELFAPVTKSIVAHVKLVARPDTFPDTVVLKIYDPRFINDRRTWSLELENAAIRRREAISRGELEDNYDERSLWYGDDDDPLHWEEWFYRSQERRFHSEFEAYKRCAPLQGAGIPRCFGAGRLPVGSSRAIKPGFILLEYIPGTLLPHIDPLAVSLPLLHSLLRTMVMIGEAGVIHNDPRPHNIMFSPPSPATPTRAVILDFSEAGLRAPEDSDEEWATIVDQNADWLGLTAFLHKAGIPGVPRPVNGLAANGEAFTVEGEMARLSQACAGV